MVFIAVAVAAAMVIGGVYVVSNDNNVDASPELAYDWQIKYLDDPWTYTPEDGSPAEEITFGFLNVIAKIYLKNLTGEKKEGRIPFSIGYLSETAEMVGKTPVTFSLDPGESKVYEVSYRFGTRGGGELEIDKQSFRYRMQWEDHFDNGPDYKPYPIAPGWFISPGSSVGGTMLYAEWLEYIQTHNPNAKPLWDRNYLAQSENDEPVKGVIQWDDSTHRHKETRVHEDGRTLTVILK